MTHRVAMLLWPILVGVLMLSTRAVGGIDAAQFQRDLAALTATPSRAIGTPGYASSQTYLREQIRSLKGVELQEHTFTVMVPHTESATLTVNGREVKVSPFAPAGIRLNTTPLEGITGELVYCGAGDYKDIRPASVNGNIAVIEASAREDWKTVAYFGARALIILGNPDVSNQDLRTHEIPIPVNVPRFYLDDPQLAEQLRKQTSIKGTLKASANWRRETATNFYAYVQPTNPLPARNEKGETVKAYSAMTIVAPYDATGIVYDNSPAAGQAAQVAAALAMLRDYAANPARRPVLVAFTGADSLNLIGSRQMLMALEDAPEKWRTMLAEEVEPAIAALTTDLNRARELKGDPTGLDVTRDRTLLDRIVKLIETDIAMEQDELFRLRVIDPAQLTAEQKARIKDLTDRQIFLGQIKYSFTSNPKSLAKKEFGDHPKSYLQRVLARMGDDPKHEGLSTQYANRKRELERRIELYEWLARLVNDDGHTLEARIIKSIKRLPAVQWVEGPLPNPRSVNPQERVNDDRLIELIIALDLSDRGVRCGPMYWGRMAAQQTTRELQLHKEWFESIVGTKSKAGADWYASLAAVLDFDSLTFTRTPLSYLSAPVASPAEMAYAWGVPAMTMATFEDLRLRRDTPTDTVANLRVQNLLPQANAVHELLRHAFDAPKFIGEPENRRYTNEFVGQVVSTASGRPVPDLPREGFLASYLYINNTRKIPGLQWQPYAMNVRRIEVVDCDAEGRYRFEGLPRMTTLKQLAVRVYSITPDSGQIVASTDLGKQSADLKQTVHLDQEITPVKSVVFNSQEFTLLGLYDPRFLQGLAEVQIMDARRNAEPQRFDASLTGQMMAGAMEPGSRAYLLFRYGRIGNRIVLLNMPEPGTAKKRSGVRGEGDGYEVSELSKLGPIALVTARDFWRLNDSRIEQYRKAGVTSTLIDEMHASAKRQIEAAEAALKANDADTLMKNATGAWADEARVYDAAQKMANDVIYAAIFLLLLAVPFSFCMERLLVGTPNIYKQIAYAAFIFALMAAALWMFHPAFKISSSPLIIILAFAIILMSIIVISVVYQKFDTELKRIRSGRGTAQAASFASASVLMSAVMLGIANMRRRKFRTALTSITVVLITFAVLCFTSASRYQSTISLPTGEDASYPGLLLRQRGFRTMPIEALDSLRSVYPDKTLVERWWTLSAWDQKEQVHLLAGGADIDGKPARVVPMPALLGLTPGESALSPIGHVISNYDRLEKGETNIIYLAQSVADQLKVKIGENLQIAGMSLELAGTYDANDFDVRVTMLSGESLAPLKYSGGALDASGRKLTDQNSDTLDLNADDSAAEASASYEHLPSNQFAIVPAAVSRRLENTSLRTIGMKLGGASIPADKVSEPLKKVLIERFGLPVNATDAQAQTAWSNLSDTDKDDASVHAVASDIVKRFALATFAGYSDGVKLVSASNLSSIGGGANVAIPLAIGGLIIFNTMMGSIAERKREIHVYTSLGLAPVHVGALFVAEALTYGLIGSVFGYIIGQGVGTAMLKLGWLGNVTLNYSGSSAMLTLGLILLIVLLSALVPARLASKIAAPSIERSWRVPAPVGDQIIAGLPFTINRTAAEGVIGYLAEFFEAHQEGSIGKFSAGKVEAFSGTNDAGQPTRGLKTVIWLTPFDLGVRQHLLLLIHPGEFQDIYEVQVVLQRLSGDDGSWWRMNRSFLTELRKQFLQWRSLSPQRMKDFVEESRRLFKEVPKDVVTTDTGEEVRLA